MKRLHPPAWLWLMAAAVFALLVAALFVSDAPDAESEPHEPIGEVRLVQAVRAFPFPDG